VLPAHFAADVELHQGGSSSGTLSSRRRCFEFGKSYKVFWHYFNYITNGESGLGLGKGLQ